MKTIKLITFALSLLFLPTVIYAVNLGDIVTIAGGGVGDNGIATSQCVNRPTGVTVDSSGNLYIASDNRIRKVASGTGIITTVAGNGTYGYSGDNGLATLASFKNTYSVAVDSSGNLYIADQDNNRIRKVAYGTGIITTVASVNSPAGITVDSNGNLYIADFGNNCIRKVASGTGIITTVAGNGTAGFSGDNGAATAASLNHPNAVAVDSSDNLYIVDGGNRRIRKVDYVTGVISTVAGNGTQGFSGDNGTATSASLNNPYGVTIDNNGNLYFGDLNTSRIRKVDSGTGIITTVAGNGTEAYAGDNGPATSASFDYPRDVTVDSSGNLYIADYINNRIRKVDSGTGIITTVAGNGTEAYAGDNGPATSASFDNLRGGVTVDSTGNFYIADYNNNRIRKVASGTGIITTVAGNGTGAYAGDNGPATSASLYSPSHVAIDSSGNLFIADTTNHRIRKVAIGTGIITTVAGSSIGGFGGDNGPATSARLYWPSGVTFDSNDNLYIADYGNHRIRKVASGTGVITSVAGNGSAGFSGDGGAAIAASLYRPSEVIVDSSGNLYFAEYYNQRIRKVVNGTGIITTVAGNGTQGFSGDNVAATSASLNNPWGVTIDNSGNLYIADEWNHRIRKVDSGTGIITTVAGNGSYGFSGDNGPATSANVYDPTGVTIDSSGNLYITEWGTGRIRKVYLNLVPTVTALVSSTVGNSSVSGSAVTFTATVTSTEVIPTSTIVTFKDGAATIGNGVLDATGTATFTTSSLAPGSHNITASYPDTGILAGSTSPVLVQTVIGSPIVTTGSVSSICTTTATLGGTINDNGAATTVNFDYGLTTGYGSSATASLSPLAANAGYTSVSAGVNGLACGTTYHFRVNGQNSVGTTNGLDTTFTTTACPAPGSVIITTVAGNGSPTFAGDGGPATAASFYYPHDVTVDSVGNLYIADTFNYRIRKLTTDTGIISTVAGTSTSGYSGDGGLATAAKINCPYDVTVDSAGNIYIADTYNNRIRRVDAVTGVISTVAGNGTGAFAGDGGPATSASLNNPIGVAVDSADNLYISDTYNNRIRRVDASSGIITTVAGNGNGAFSGDGGAATSASIYWPYGINVDSTGNLFIADYMNMRIRKIEKATGNISTVAGKSATGNITYTGEGGPATNATLPLLHGVTVDGNGNVFIAEANSSRILKVDAVSGLISTVAGNGIWDFSGDGGEATSATLQAPTGVTSDNAGNLYVADNRNHRIRKVIGAVPLTDSNTITAAAGPNGSISPAGASMVTSGANQVYTITPNPGFTVAALVVDGVQLPGATSHTFTNVSAGHYINAYFTPAASYTITAAAGPNGTISPAGASMVTSGANQTYTITPNPGFTVAALVVDGVLLPGATSYTFSNVTGTHYINAYFQ